jgi:hypothetical protein
MLCVEQLPEFLYSAASNLAQDYTPSEQRAGLNYLREREAQIDVWTARKQALDRRIGALG